MHPRCSPAESSVAPAESGAFALVAAGPGACGAAALLSSRGGGAAGGGEGTSGAPIFSVQATNDKGPKK